MRVYVDASVIIAALLSKTGGSALLLRYVEQGIIKGIVSQTVLEEAYRLDKSKRRNISNKQIGEYIAHTGLMVCERITRQEIERYRDVIEDKDAHLLAGAKLTKCDYLVSLDRKHVVREDLQGKVLPLKIVVPGEMLEAILSKGM